MWLLDYSWFKNYFFNILYTEIQQSPFYSVSFDESLNKDLQKGQMDQLVRIRSNEKKMVVTRYFNFEFMGRAKAEKILQTFEKGILFKYPQMDLTLTCVLLNFLLKKGNQKNSHH